LFYLSWFLALLWVFLDRIRIVPQEYHLFPLALALFGWYFVRPVVSGLVHPDRPDEPEEWPSVTVQMPAYNEEDGVAESVRSVIDQDYPGDLEVVVVDDGSTDDTWPVLLDLADQYDEVLVATKENEGIGPTRNRGLSMGTGEIVVSMDSDTVLEDSALRALVASFDSETAAVASNVTVRNTGDSWWCRAQSLEYLVSMEMARSFQARFRHLLVVSGGCGAYRREVLEKVDGWGRRGNYLAEDFDLTVRASEHGRVRFCPYAIARTEVPSTLSGWWSQRIMWAGRGLRTVLHHRDVMGDTDHGLLGLFALPFKLAVSVVLLWSVGKGLVETVAGLGGPVMGMVGVYLSVVGVTSALALFLLGCVACYCYHTEPLYDLGVLPAYLLVYRQLHVIVRCVAFVYVIGLWCVRKVLGRA
jgi:cellulose synthase/poly-beta-1,6-N-acetylglucosamine synthase-like glycosyltransferase